MDTYFSIIKKKAAIVIDDDLIMFKSHTIYSNPIVILKEGRLVKINKCKDAWCKVNLVNLKDGLKIKSYGAYFNKI